MVEEKQERILLPSPPFPSPSPLGEIALKFPHDVLRISLIFTLKTPRGSKRAQKNGRATKPQYQGTKPQYDFHKNLSLFADTYSIRLVPSNVHNGMQANINLCALKPKNCFDVH